MEDLLKQFVGKTLRIYTCSGVESYLAVLQEVKPEYLVLKETYSGEIFYLAIGCIESFKEMGTPKA
jgi:ferredoxin-fold anticodon binding domain-containing protein